MRKIFFIGWNGWGHVNPTLSILKKLAFNNKVVYLNSPCFNDVVKETGVEVINNRYMNLVYKFFDSNELTRKRILSESEFLDATNQFYDKSDYLFILLDQVAKLIERINPDLIIHDSCAHVVKYICKTISIPRISIQTLFAINREMLLKDTFFMEKLYGVHVASTSKELIEKVDIIAKRCEKRTGFYYDYFDTFLCEAGLNLVLTSADFQPYIELLRNNYKFIGNDISYRKEKESMMSVSEKCGKRVLISLGSVLSGLSCYQELYYRIMDKLKDIDAIFILVVGEMQEINKANVPPNFKIVNYVPQLRTLESVDLFITHGGFNSVSEAILNEVPMIVWPQIDDQFINAKQVEEKHLGRVLYDQDIDVDILKNEIINILESNKYKDALHSMKISYKKALEENDIDELLENYCNLMFN